MHKVEVLLQNRIPVPEGYAIASEAFENGTLFSKAETELTMLIKKLPQKGVDNSVFKENPLNPTETLYFYFLTYIGISQDQNDYRH